MKLNLNGGRTLNATIYIPLAYESSNVSEVIIPVDMGLPPRGTSFWKFRLSISHAPTEDILTVHEIEKHVPPMLK